jgi:hypothetical protein
MAANPGPPAQGTYRVWGMDSFEVAPDQRGVISYDGFQTLTSDRRGGATRFIAKADYTRIDQGARSARHAYFIQTVGDDGEVRDGDDNTDPDFLTILNQPFSVALDPPAMRELVRLAAPVPFDFPTPIVGASLRGELVRRPPGTIAGRPAVGLSFNAAGPMRGRLPGAAFSLDGQMRLAGQAFYDKTTLVLLSLEMTLEISGNISGASSPQPVKITYRRSIRYDPQAKTLKEARP